MHVLAVIKESSYEGGTMGDDHPISWAHHYDGGRAWYTGLGHTVESYAEPYMRAHLLGGIEWAAGFAEADVTATLASAYDEVVLTTELTDPMEIDITSDGRVFIIEWAGSIKIWEPATGAMRVIGWLPVDKNIEDGLLGLALDPTVRRQPVGIHLLLGYSRWAKKSQPVVKICLRRPYARYGQRNPYAGNPGSAQHVLPFRWFGAI